MFNYTWQLELQESEACLKTAYALRSLKRRNIILYTYAHAHAYTHTYLVLYSIHKVFIFPKPLLDAECLTVQLFSLEYIEANAAFMKFNRKGLPKNNAAEENQRLLQQMLCMSMYKAKV